MDHYQPTLDNIISNLGSFALEDANVIPIRKEIQIPKDVTPVSVFLKVRRGTNSFLLESADFKEGRITRV